MTTPPPDNGLSALTISLTSLAISAVLGGMRVYEFISDRRNGLTAQMMYRQTSDGPDVDLLILNAGNRPANIYYVMLDWVRPSPLGKWCPFGLKLLRNEYGSDDSFADFTIAAGGQHVSNFSKGSSIGKRPSDTAMLRLSLSVVGRNRPINIWLN